MLTLLAVVGLLMVLASVLLAWSRSIKHTTITQYHRKRLQYLTSKQNLLDAAECWLDCDDCFGTVDCVLRQRSMNRDTSRIETVTLKDGSIMHVIEDDERFTDGQ